MIGVMPAASAPRTPGSESSSTTQCGGRDTEPRGRLEEDVGRGLAARDLVAADQRDEARQRAPVCSSFACARARRVDVATALGMRSRLEPVEQLAAGPA